MLQPKLAKPANRVTSSAVMSKTIKPANRVTLNEILNFKPVNRVTIGLEANIIRHKASVRRRHQDIETKHPTSTIQHMDVIKNPTSTAEGVNKPKKHTSTVKSGIRYRMATILSTIVWIIIFILIIRDYRTNKAMRKINKS